MSRATQARSPIVSGARPPLSETNQTPMASRTRGRKTACRSRTARMSASRHCGHLCACAKPFQNRSDANGVPYHRRHASGNAARWRCSRASRVVGRLQAQLALVLPNGGSGALLTGISTGQQRARRVRRPSLPIPFSSCPSRASHHIYRGSAVRPDRADGRVRKPLPAAGTQQRASRASSSPSRAACGSRTTSSGACDLQQTAEERTTGAQCFDLWCG